MTKEEIVIEGDGERDKVESIEETEDEVVLYYKKGEQVRPIHIPMKYIHFVKKVILKMDVGVAYTSKYVYNNVIDYFSVKSEIVTERLPVIKQVLEEHKLQPMQVSGIMSDIERSAKITKMSFRELIGTRDTKTSLYFKVYGSLRYYAQKGIISYNSRGTIYRLI